MKFRFGLTALFLGGLGLASFGFGSGSLHATDAASPVKVTPDNFKAEVLRSKLPVMVDVGATWCGPCHLLAPTVEKMSEVYSGKLKVADMDADQNSDLVGKLGVQAFPTLLFFKNGKVVKTLIGLQTEKDLRLEIDHFLKSAQKEPVRPS
jgi:thioredoxin 1